MDLLNQISLALRAAAHGLAGQPSAPGDPAAASAALLKAAQQRVERLNKQLNLSEAREKGAELAWRVARSQADALEHEVNAATRAGQDDAARAKLAQLNQAQNHVQQLSDRWHQHATASEKLRIEIQDLQAQLNTVRQRLAAAGSPSNPPAQMVTPAQQPAASAGQPSTEPATREQRLATPQDNPATSQELDTTRIADLLKKRDP